VAVEQLVEAGMLVYSAQSEERASLPGTQTPSGVKELLRRFALPSIVLI